MNTDTGDLVMLGPEDEVPEGFVPITDADFKRLAAIESKKARKAEFVKSLQQMESMANVKLKALRR